MNTIDSNVLHIANSAVGVMDTLYTIDSKHTQESRSISIAGYRHSMIGINIAYNSIVAGVEHE